MSAQDSNYTVAVQFCKTRKTVTADMIKRKLKVDYSEAMRLVEALRENGVIGNFQKQYSNYPVTTCPAHP